MDGADISKLYHMEFAVTSANPVIDEDERVSNTNSFHLFRIRQSCDQV